MRRVQHSQSKFGELKIAILPTILIGKNLHLPLHISQRLVNVTFAILKKTIILFSTDKNVLNKRSELMNKCRHRNKYLLSAIKWGTVIWKRNFFKDRNWKSSSQPWNKSTNFKKIHNIIPPPASDECTSTKQVVMLPPINFDIKWSFLPELISSTYYIYLF